MTLKADIYSKKKHMRLAVEFLTFTYLKEEDMS
jgi:hypothetical protein